MKQRSGLICIWIMGIAFSIFSFIMGQIYAIYFNEPIRAFEWTIISLFLLPAINYEINYDLKDIKARSRKNEQYREL